MAITNTLIKNINTPATGGGSDDRTVETAPTPVPEAAVKPAPVPEAATEASKTYYKCGAEYQRGIGASYSGNSRLSNWFYGREQSVGAVCQSNILKPFGQDMHVGLAYVTSDGFGQQPSVYENPATVAPATPEETAGSEGPMPMPGVPNEDGTPTEGRVPTPADYNFAGTVARQNRAGVRLTPGLVFSAPTWKPIDAVAVSGSLVTGAQVGVGNFSGRSYAANFYDDGQATHHDLSWEAGVFAKPRVDIRLFDNLQLSLGANLSASAQTYSLSPDWQTVPKPTNGNFLTLAASGTVELTWRFGEGAKPVDTVTTEPAKPEEKAVTPPPVEPAKPEEKAVTPPPVEPAKPEEKAVTPPPVEPAKPEEKAVTPPPAEPAKPATPNLTE